MDSAACSVAAAEQTRNKLNWYKHLAKKKKLLS